MKKTTLSIALVSALGICASAAQATVITWGNSAGSVGAYGDVISAAGTPRIGNPGSVDGLVPFSDPFAAGMEFRMVGPTNAVGGGGEKDYMYGGETWTFAGDSQTGGALTGVGGTPLNSGVDPLSLPSNSAAPLPDTNPTIGQNAPFFFQPFNFLAPTVGSLADTAYGAGQLNFDSTDNFTIFFNVLEAQWGGTYFPLGQDDTNGSNGLGVTFDCTGALTGNVHCEAEELIDPSEDPGAAGFAMWTAQWDLYGTMTPVHSAVPVPAAVWLFGSGLLGLVGVARRKKA